MITIDNTISGEFANSYVDTSYADDYWRMHFSTIKAEQWAALSDDQKTILLVNACGITETARYTVSVELPSYALHYDSKTQLVRSFNTSRTPVKYAYNQNLQFPRNFDVSTTTGDTYIPDSAMRAQCEQALYLLTLDESGMASRLQGVVRDQMSIGKGQISVSQEYAAAGSMFSPIALEILRPYMVKGGRTLRA